MGLMGTRYFYNEALPALLAVLKMPLTEGVPILLKALICGIIISFVGFIIFIISRACDIWLSKKLSIDLKKLENQYDWIIIGIVLLALCGLGIITLHNYIIALEWS